jgi:hypothetical protein
MSSLHDVDVRLFAFLDQHYHRAPHASLMGRSPGTVFAARERPADDLDEQKLKDALTVRERRRVRADTTVSVDGQDWKLDQGFLAGRVVTVGRSLLDGAPCVEHEDLRPARRSRPPPGSRLPPHVLPQRDAWPARLLPPASQGQRPPQAAASPARRVGRGAAVAATRSLARAAAPRAYPWT